jgi:hypothetical protein
MNGLKPEKYLTGHFILVSEQFHLRWRRWLWCHYLYEFLLKRFNDPYIPYVHYDNEHHEQQNDPTTPCLFLREWFGGWRSVLQSIDDSVEFDVA